VEIRAKRDLYERSSRIAQEPKEENKRMHASEQVAVKE
jgi:hypothetical protein